MKKLFLITLSYFALFFFFFIFCSNSTKVSATAPIWIWDSAFSVNGPVPYIKVSRLHNGTVYAATQEVLGGYDLLKTVDNGKTWASIKGNLSTGNDINWISLSSNEDAIAVSVWGSGVFITKDGGSTWTKVFNSAYARSVEIHPLDNDKIYVGAGNTNNSVESGLYFTTDGGQLWNRVATFGNRNSGQIIFGLEPLTILAGGDPNFYKSTNDGTTWAQLSINQVYSNTIIDASHKNVFYSSQYGQNEGVYKSLDYGTTWTAKSNGIQAPAFRLSQDTSGHLFATTLNRGGGLWTSKDGAESWENIQDPTWGTRNTLGLDAKDGRVFVGVEGLGIFYADIPPEGPNPVVFVPGLAGSWSYKGLVENQPTVPSDWILTPHFSDQYYQPLLATLNNAGLSTNATLFVFAYDWRKSIADSAILLNSYLDSEVLAHNPGKKINIVGHSMGGLVARYCIEKVSGCSQKIDKLITGGSPHRGAIQSYKVWEGGQIEESNPVLRSLEEVVLHTTGLPYLTNKDIVQHLMPGFRDILPNFDYLVGKPYSTMSLDGKNPLLEFIASPSAALTQRTVTFSGLNLPTDRSYTITAPPPWETALGMWKDGKPTTSQTDLGDGTSLQFSSSLPGITDRRFALEHKDYFANATSLSEMLQILGLSGTPVTTSIPTTSFLLFIVRSPATLSVKDSGDNSVGTNIDGKAVFISNPNSSSYKVSLVGTGNGTYTVQSFYSNGNGQAVSKSTVGTVTTGQNKTETFVFSPTLVQRFEDPLAQNSFNSFIASLDLVPGSKSIVMKDKMRKLYTSIHTAANKKTVLTQLEGEYANLLKMVLDEQNEEKKTLLFAALTKQLIFLDTLTSLYGTLPAVATVNSNIARAQGHITRMQTKVNPGVQKALTISVANTLFEAAKSSQATSEWYLANLQAQGVINLLGGY